VLIVWFKVDYRSSKPVYEQIKERIKEQILTKKLNPGEYLPSIRTLAQDIGVNLNTVSRSYRELEAEGFVLSEKGLGYTVKTVQEDKIETEIMDEFTQYVKKLKRSGIPQSKAIETIKNIYGNGGEENGTCPDKQS
jgi:GntR family transcriptional regulator